MHFPSLASSLFLAVTFTVASGIALQPRSASRQDPTDPDEHPVAEPDKGYPSPDGLDPKILDPHQGHDDINGDVDNLSRPQPLTVVGEGDPCAVPEIFCGDEVITEGICELDVFVKTVQVEFAINEHGSFGSKTCPNATLGMHQTSCGNGAGLGIVSSNGQSNFTDEWAGDFFIPGVPYEGWQMRVRNGTGVVLDMEGSLKDSSVHGEGTVRVSGGKVIYEVEHKGMRVELSYWPHPKCIGISMNAKLTPTVPFDENEILYFARSVVPDPGEPWGEDFGTNQVVTSPQVGDNGKFAMVTSHSPKGRTMTLVACDGRANAGIGGFGFLYDLPTYTSMSKMSSWVGKSARDSDQDIWMIWKSWIPAVGETMSLDYYYLTRGLAKPVLDGLMCVKKTPEVPGSEAPNATVNETVPSSEAPNETVPSSEAPSSPPKAPPSASGDPHLVNIRGQRFDIYKVGQIEFLRVPKKAQKEQANFTAVATIQDVAGSTSRCKQSRYITSMNFGGTWLKDKPLEVSMDRGHMNVMLGGVQMKPSLQPLTIGRMVKVHLRDETQLIVKVGKAKIVVSRDIQPVHFFLNVQATSLGKLGYKIGGLLGEDDNADVSTPPSECKNLMMLSTAKNNTLRSTASASI